MLKEVPLSVSFYMFLLEVNRHLGHKKQLGMRTKDSQCAEKNSALLRLFWVESILGFSSFLVGKLHNSLIYSQMGLFHDSLVMLQTSHLISGHF